MSSEDSQERPINEDDLRLINKLWIPIVAQALCYLGMAYAWKHHEYLWPSLLIQIVATIFFFISYQILRRHFAPAPADSASPIRSDGKSCAMSGRGAGMRLKGIPVATLAIIFAGILLRLPLIAAPPRYSDDMYRYIWEARAWEANPFVHAPDHPALEPLRRQIPDISANINHPSFPAIYPPFIQFVFIGVTSLFGSSPIAFKAGLSLLELATIIAMGLYLARSRLPDYRLALYVWNPLAITEIAGNGHFDFVVVGLLTGFFLLYRSTNRPPSRKPSGGWFGNLKTWGAAACLAAAIMTKFLPVVLWPFLFARRLSRSRRALRWAVPLCAIGIGAAYHVRFHLPSPDGLVDSPDVIDASQLTDRIGYWGSLGQYSVRWRRSEFAFYGLEYYVVATGFAEKIERRSWKNDTTGRALRRIAGFHDMAPPETQLTKSLVAAGLAMLALGLALFPLFGPKGSARAAPLSPETIAYILFSAVFCFSPIIYPWYLLLMFPMLLRRSSPAWFWLMATLPLTYISVDIFAITGQWRDEGDLLFAIYLPFFVLLAVELWLGAKQRLHFRNDF